MVMININYTERSFTKWPSTDTDIDLHLEIDIEWRLRAKLYDKRYHLNFPTVNFMFICSNIPEYLYKEYISLSCSDILELVLSITIVITERS
jgi:DNA-dependent RNA polymerase auxiliary subunit epsilon